MTTVLSPAEVRAPRVLDLASFGDRVALWTGEGTLTYADLAGRVDEVGRRLGDTRRLVLVEGANTVASLTAYLGALTHGHVVLLAPPGRPARQLAEAWDPDVVATGDRLRERRPGTRHDLHPDLALLLSTSGSTGSPKLVRLSHDNLRANAASIADYLGLTPDDRAITSLPLHYCYGLSVVHSHLLTGAGAGADRPVRRRRVLLAARGGHGRHLVRRASPTPSTCWSAPASPSGGCPGCATSPRPAAGSAPTGSGTGARAASRRAGTWSSCTARPRRPPGWRGSRRCSPAPGRRRSASPCRAGSSGSSRSRV